MKGSDVFESKSLKAADIKGKGPVTVIIAKVAMMEFKDEPSKPVIHFTAKNGTPLEKTLVVNRTNWYSIADQLGEDSDEWIGQAITLIAAKTDYQGKRVDCIRVDDPPAKGNVSRKPAKPEPVEDNTPFVDDARDDLDGDIPF